MPRIFSSDNEPHDFCQGCFPKTEEIAFEEFGGAGNGPDDRGNCFAYDADHPAYEYDDYKCCKCKKQLSQMDEMKRDFD